MNRLNFEVGKTYILDGNYITRSRVILISKGNMFCTVQSVEGGGQWEVMINRLTELPKDAK